MKLSGHIPFHYLLAAFLLVALIPQVQAAPLNLPSPFPDPDIITNGAGVTYVYDGDDVNTLTITGLAGGVPSTQFITIPGGNSLNGGPTAAISGTEIPGVDVPVTPGSYLLTADFNNAGAFLGGSVSVGGYVVNPFAFGASTAAEAFFAGTNSGTVLTMDLDQFGFTGTQAASGDRDTIIFEWSATVTGGDLSLLNFATGGAVAVGNVFWNTLNPLNPGGGSFGTNPGDQWDPLASNDMSAFTSSFVSCDLCPLQMDTFVPVPAAVWLFGSGLLGLIGIGARRRKLLNS